MQNVNKNGKKNLHLSTKRYKLIACIFVFRLLHSLAFEEVHVAKNYNVDTIELIIVLLNTIVISNFLVHIFIVVL